MINSCKALSIMVVFLLDCLWSLYITRKQFYHKVLCFLVGHRVVLTWNIGKFYCSVFLHGYNDQRALGPWIAPVLKSIERRSAVLCGRPILYSDGLQTCAKSEWRK